MRGIDTTSSVSVEPAPIVDGAASALVLTDGGVDVVVVAVGGPDLAAHVAGNQAASTGGGVQGRDVVGGVVPVLVDVNLTITGPVLSRQPVRRPCATDRLGEVCEGGNEETLVVHRLALQSHTAPSLQRSEVGSAMIHSDVHLTALGGYYAGVMGILLASVVDVTTGWVDIVVVTGAKTAGEEVELVKEVGRVVALRALVRLSGGSRSCAGIGQGSSAQGEERGDHYD